MARSGIYSLEHTESEMMFRIPLLEMFSQRQEKHCGTIINYSHALVEEKNNSNKLRNKGIPLIRSMNVM